jgi:hypothetical protein
MKNHIRVTHRFCCEYTLKTRTRKIIPLATFVVLVVVVVATNAHLPLRHCVVGNFGGASVSVVPVYQSWLDFVVPVVAGQMLDTPHHYSPVGGQWVRRTNSAVQIDNTKTTSQRIQQR